MSVFSYSGTYVMVGQISCGTDVGGTNVGGTNVGGTKVAPPTNVCIIFLYLNGAPDLTEVLKRMASGIFDRLEDGSGGGQSDFAAVSADRDSGLYPDRHSSFRSFRVFFLQI